MTSSIWRRSRSIRTASSTPWCANWLEQGRAPSRSCAAPTRWVQGELGETIDLVAGEIQRVQRDVGPQAIHAGSLRLEERGHVPQQPPLLHRLMNLAGGFTGYARRLLHRRGPGDHVPRDGLHPEVYEQQTAWPNVVEHAELVVLWGSTPQVTLKNSWNMPDHEGQAGFKALKEKARVISIDPSAKDRQAGQRRVDCPKRLHRRSPCAGGGTYPL